MSVQDAPNPLIHRVTMNPGSETQKAKTRMDEILDEREERAAKRYSAAELEKMALESENEAARLRGEPPKYKHHGGESMDDEEKKKQEEKQAQQRDKMTASAISLINSGMEPAQVGQMLMGLTPTGTAPAVSQGMGLDDVLKIVNLVVGKKEADELKDIIADLGKKVDDMTKNPPAAKVETKPVDPVAFAKQQAETLRIYHETLDELGMIPKPEVRTSDGKSLEVVKEQNRHDEKMAGITADKEYKQNLTEIVTDIPDRVGRGIASQLREGEGEKSSSVGAGLEYIDCTEEGCGQRIPVTPETGPQIVCPKCQAIYQKRETVETKTE